MIYALYLLAFAYADSSSSSTIFTVMSSINSNVGDISGFIISMYYVVGIGVALAGIMRLKKLGVRSAMMGGDGSVGGPIVQLLIGAALVYSPSLLASLNTTFWGDPSFQSALSWSAQESGSSGTASQIVAVITPLVGIIKLIGTIAFLRGWLVMSRISNGGSQQPGQISKGVVHIIGGVLAMNITKTMTVIMNTLGL